MSIAETTSDTSGRGGSLPTAKILQFKQALQQRTGAVGGWAQERAGAMRTAVQSRPVATAGVSAGAALVGGIAIGLLLAGRMGPMKTALAGLALPLAAKAKDLIRR